jgi:hypothetical protein
MWYLNGNFKESWFSENIQRKRYNPTPFCLPHIDSLEEKSYCCKKLHYKRFDKWYKFPASSYKLYWRLHDKWWLK